MRIELPDKVRLIIQKLLIMPMLYPWVMAIPVSET